MDTLGLPESTLLLVLVLVLGLPASAEQLAGVAAERVLLSAMPEYVFRLMMNRLFRGEETSISMASLLHRIIGLSSVLLPALGTGRHKSSDRSLFWSR